MSCRLLLISVSLVVFSSPAFANWWIVRSSDGECLVVDIEPAGAGVTKIGNAVLRHTGTGRNGRQSAL